MIKNTTTGGENWHILDSARDQFSPTTQRLIADASTQENGNDEHLDLLSNGFKVRWNNAGFNNNGDEYIFISFAEHPFKDGLATLTLTDKWISAISNSTGEIDTRAWDDLNNISSNEIFDNQQSYYALSTDAKRTFFIGDNVNGLRNIVSDDVNVHGGVDGDWYINTDATYSSETWVAATVNDIHSAIEEAMNTTQNQMSSSQMGAVSDSIWNGLSDTFNIAMMVYSLDGSEKNEIQNVTINYDGSLLNSLQTHNYTIDHPSVNEIRIKAPSTGGNRNCRVVVSKG